MIQFKKIITSKSVLLFLIVSTTTSHGFIKKDNRDTSRRSNIHDSRSLLNRRQKIERNLNIQNGAHKIDEKDRVYENLYDRRSFRTETLERNESTERRSALFFIGDQRNHNRVSLNNRQRFSYDKHQSAERTRFNLYDNRRFMNKIELNRENPRQVPKDRRTNSQSTRREFDRTNARSASFDYQRITVPNEEIPEISSVDRRFRAYSPRSDSTRKIQRNSRTKHQEKETDSIRFSLENARNFERRKSRIISNKKMSNQQVRTELFGSNRNRHMSDFEQRLNALTSKLNNEYRGNTARNQLERVSTSETRNGPKTENTRRDFRLNTRNRNHFREITSRESNRRIHRNNFGNSEKKTVSIRYKLPTLEARRLEINMNVIPQARVSNSYSVGYLPEEQFSLVTTELEGKSVDLQNFRERDEYLKPNLGINSWVNAAQVILGIYLIGQIFLNSSTERKPRFYMLSTVGAVKEKIH